MTWIAPALEYAVAVGVDRRLRGARSTMINPNRLPSGLATGFVFIWITVVLGSLSILKNLEESIAAIRPYSQSALPWSVAVLGLAAILVVSVVSYLGHPTIAKADWGGLSRVGDSDPLVTETARLAEARAMRRPDVLVDDDILNFEAMAFGFPLRRKLALGRGYRLLLLKDKAQFEARLSHELAHIRNKDMDVAFIERGAVVGFFGLTIAALSYFVVCLVQVEATPALKTTDSANLFAGAAYMSLTCLLWPLVVWIAHKRFVQAREFLADAEAAAWTSPQIVMKALSGSQVDEKWRNYLLSHPTPLLRTRSVLSFTHAGYPSPLTFLGIGYLYGAFTAISSAMLTAAGFSSGNTAIEFSTAELLRQTMLSIFNQPDLALAWLLVVLASALAIPSFLILCIRQAAQGVALGRSLGAILLRASLSAGAFGLGAIGGSQLSPTRVALLLTGARTSPLIVDQLPLGGFAPSGLALYGGVLACGALFLMLVAIPLAVTVVRGRRKSPIRSWEWVVLFASIVYGCSGFVFGTIVSAMPRDPSSGSPIDMQTVAEFYAPVLLVAIVMFTAMRPRLPSNKNGLAPWVTRP